MTGSTELTPQVQIEALVKARITDLIKECVPVLQIPVMLANEYPQVRPREHKEWLKSTLREYAKTDKRIERERPRNLGQQILAAEYLYNLALKTNKIKDSLEVLKYIGTLKGLDGPKGQGSSGNVNIQQNFGALKDMTDEQLQDMSTMPIFISEADSKRLEEG